MRTVSLEDRVRMVLRRGSSMLEEYWNKTAEGYVKDMIDTSLTTAVPESLLKIAETFEVPETVEI